MKKIKARVGITGSADILHPFRFSRDGKLTPFVNPHYHCIAFGWIDGDQVREVFRQYGVVVKKIRTLENNKIFPVAKYVLTHAGVRPKTHAVVYTGALSYSKLRLPKEEKEPVKCPYCPLQLELIRLIPGVQVDRPPPITPDFTGLVDYDGFEYITDFDYHYYNLDWSRVSSKEANAHRVALREMAESLKERICEAQRDRSRGIEVLDGWR